MIFEESYDASSSARFATGRGRMCRKDIEFIEQCAKRGVSVQNIATIVARPVRDVRVIVKMLVDAGAVHDPSQPVVYLSLWKGFITLKPTSRDIVRTVADAHGLTVEELVGVDRSKRVAYPRQELMWRLRQTGKYSLSQIGHMLGDRDHTTILHGCRAHERRMEAVAAEIAAVTYTKEAAA